MSCFWSSLSDPMPDRSSVSSSSPLLLSITPAASNSYRASAGAFPLSLAVMAAKPMIALPMSGGTCSAGASPTGANRIVTWPPVILSTAATRASCTSASTAGDSGSMAFGMAGAMACVRAAASACVESIAALSVSSSFIGIKAPTVRGRGRRSCAA